MARRILITGGAGFIGSHLCDELLEAGYAVRVLDSLSPQVHSDASRFPDYLSEGAEMMAGDVRDPAMVRRALAGIEGVVHLAAMVGVGQSMYQIDDYVSVNDLGTAVLLQALVERPVERLVVASSMSIYGEGLYRSADGSVAEDAQRSPGQLARNEWECLDDRGAPLVPLATPESKRPAIASVYALSKYVQERICLMVGQAYGIRTSALRFFNVYGTRQALSNPYTGVLAIFASRLLNGNPPMIFEDGLQSRDFVHVRDVARACRLALEQREAADRVFNIGSGERHTIAEIAERLGRAMGRNDAPAVATGRFRVGDIRHCFADISLARDVLGYQPQVGLDEGLRELVEWLASQSAVDRVEYATRELVQRGLVA